jgi:hypothetical protein
MPSPAAQFGKFLQNLIKSHQISSSAAGVRLGKFRQRLALGFRAGFGGRSFAPAVRATEGAAPGPGAPW